jgi:hypothetical protein
MLARAYGRSNAHGDRASAQNFSVAPKKPMCITSIPANALNPSMERTTRLIARWSYSMILLRYLT